MVKNIKRILSYKATDNNKSFCLSTKNGNSTSTEMYYADIEDYININYSSYNKGCLRSQDNITIYSSLYNAKDLYMKSALYSNNRETELPDTRNFQNIFNYKLSADLSNQIQVENCIYQLNSNMSKDGKLMLSQDIYSELSLDNGYSKLPNVIISTLLFDKANLSAAKEDANVEVSAARNIPNVLYNQFFEIPGNIKNDYDSGNYAVNVYTTKNQYTSQYDMLHTKNTLLSCARQYIAIDHCNNQVYLKYYDNIDYTLADKDVKLITNETCLYGHKYQKIETLKALNRYEAVNAHKTNYYNIDIVCENLLGSFRKTANKFSEDNIRDKINKVRNNLMQEIQNCVQNICKQVVPVDTQIVKVNVLSSEI